MASILVLGAGELGYSILHALRKRLPSVPLTVLLRVSSISSTEPSKQRVLQDLRAIGINFLAGELVDGSQDELAAIFRNFSAIIGCTGFVAGRSVQLKLARAVLQAEVKYYIPWQFGVDYDVIGRNSAQDLFDEQLDVRDLLRSQSRTEWTIISTGMFTSFLFEPTFGVVDLKSDTVHALGSWATAVTVTTAEDIGTLSAEVVASSDSSLRNRVVYTAGDTVTYGQIADLLDRVLNRKLKREEWSVPYLKEDLQRDPTDALKKYRVVFAEGRGVSWDVAKSLNAQRGIEVITTEEWARKNMKSLT